MRQLLFLLLMLGNSAFAQITIGEALKSMPDSLIPYLSHNNRLDCIDFREADMKAEVRNELNGKSELLQLTDNYAFFQLNEASTLALCLLEADGQQLICMIQTYGTDLRESVVSFFTTSWQHLPTEQYLPFSYQQSFVYYDVEHLELTIEANNYLDRPAIEEQSDAIKMQTKLKWTGSKFKKS